MADWEGLRRDLERSVTPPPLDALRQRRRHRQQRRTIALTCAVVMVGSASGVALLGRANERRDQTATIQTLDRIVNSDKLPPPKDYEDYVVTDVDFVSPGTGWAIGLRCVGDSCDVATFRTDDGGRTWAAPLAVATGVPRSSYHAESPAGGAVRSLRMVDETTGYAFNPDLYVTRDGARTWQRLPQRSKVASVSVGGGTVWLTERGCAAGVDCDLVVTAGDTPLDVPETNGAAAVVRRAGATDAYVVAWDAPEAPHATFHRTRDAGRTWSAGEMPCPDALAASLSAGPGRPLWLVCTSAGGRTAFQSDDHGTSWRRLPDPPRDGVVTDLVARSATDAYLTTQTPARLYVTGDGGATWQPAEGATTKGYGFSNLDVVDATHAWAMGDAGALWRTTDGRRWERLALPPGSAPSTTAPSATPSLPVPRGLAEPGVTWTSLSFLDASRGYALGRRCAAGRCLAVLRRTTDGGANWLRIPGTAPSWPDVDDDPHPPGRVGSIAFADERNGWLFGESVWATHDGGHTWREAGGGYTYDVVPHGGFVWQVGYEGCLSNPCGASVSRTPVTEDDTRYDGYDEERYGAGRYQAAFAAPDALHAYLLDTIGANPGVLSLTSDGGDTWHDVPAPCDSARDRELAASSPAGLWALCVGGDDREAVTVSTDGGTTWRTALLPGPDGSLGTVVPLSADDAWLADGGRLAVTHDGGKTWATAAGIAKPSAVTFADAQHGWLLSGNALWRTTDGATWQRLG